MFRHAAVIVACFSVGHSLRLSGAPDSEVTSSPDLLESLFEEVEAARDQAITKFAREPTGGTDMEPRMEADEREAFYKLLANATNYQEFGSGGSTVVAVRFDNIKRIHTLESDPDWIATLKKRPDISEAIAKDRLHLVHTDIGRVGAWGWPVDQSGRANYPSYSSPSVESDVKFDLVLVDGRFRVACFLHALQRIQDPLETLVAIHDYDRKSYHVVERHAVLVERVRNFAVFRKKGGAAVHAKEALDADYEKFKYTAA